MKSFRVSLGGFAITAFSLTRLGIPCSLVSVIGNDPFGRILWEKLTQWELDTSGINIYDTASTNVSIAFPHKNDRSFLTRAMEQDVWLGGVLKVLQSVEYNQVSHIHLSVSLLKYPKILHFVKRCKAQGTTVSLDVGWADAQNWKIEEWTLVHLADIFKPNESEALRITAASDIQTALKVLDTYCSHPVITLGSKGAVGIDEKGNPLFVPSYAVELRNTIGAGDAFTAGYLYGFLKGMPSQDCLQYGNAAGALTVGSELSIAEEMSLSRLKALMNGREKS